MTKMICYGCETLQEPVLKEEDIGIAGSDKTITMQVYVCAHCDNICGYPNDEEENHGDS